MFGHCEGMVQIAALSVPMGMGKTVLQAFVWVDFRASG